MSTTRAWLPPALLLLSFLAFAAGAASARRVEASGTTDVTVPAPDTPPRDAILDAVRARLGATSRFSVDHIAMAATDRPYAFVRATGIVAVEGAASEAQEGDRTVMALLVLPPGDGGWRVLELWTLPEEAEHPRRDFARRVRERQAAARLPAALFPADLLADRY